MGSWESFPPSSLVSLSEYLRPEILKNTWNANPTCNLVREWILSVLSLKSHCFMTFLCPRTDLHREWWCFLNRSPECLNRVSKLHVMVKVVWLSGMLKKPRLAITSGLHHLLALWLRKIKCLNVLKLSPSFLSNRGTSEVIHGTQTESWKWLAN